MISIILYVCEKWFIVDVAVFIIIFSIVLSFSVGWFQLRLQIFHHIFFCCLFSNSFYYTFIYSFSVFCFSILISLTFNTLLTDTKKIINYITLRNTLRRQTFKSKLVCRISNATANRAPCFFTQKFGSATVRRSPYLDITVYKSKYEKVFLKKKILEIKL